jgi:hypothetical protein
MKHLASTSLVALFALFIFAAADAPQTLHFPIHGFSIAPLESSTAGKNASLFTMYLPASGNFAPNIVVMAQDSPGSMDDYMALSKRQVDEQGWKSLKSEKVDDNTAIFEFTGKSKDTPIHWYSKASRKGAEVILVTATATEQQWSDSGAQLQACVDSFKRDPAN